MVLIYSHNGLTRSRRPAVKADAALNHSRVPVHGIPARWHAGCRCDTCTDAMRKDHLVVAVGNLRSTGLDYKGIGTHLGISTSKAQRAGREAGYSGHINRPADGIPAQCAWPECGLPARLARYCEFHEDRARRGIPMDAPVKARTKFTDEQRAELVTAVVELRSKELSYAEIGRRLGIEKATASNFGREAGLSGRVKPPLQHGTKARWSAGCGCDICTESRRQDPLVVAVGALRSTGLEYKEIARRLGVSPKAAGEAGKAAGFSGHLKRTLEHGSPARWRAGCRCDLCVDANRAYMRPYQEKSQERVGAKRVAERAAQRARSAAHRQPWTQDDVQTVMRDDLSIQELAVMLGRTSAAVNNKRRDLTLTADTRETTRRKGGWTPADVQTALRTDLTLQQIADMLGRTYSAVASKRRLTMLRAATNNAAR